MKKKTFQDVLSLEHNRFFVGNSNSVSRWITPLSLICPLIRLWSWVSLPYLLLFHNDKKCIHFYHSLFCCCCSSKEEIIHNDRQITDLYMCSVVGYTVVMHLCKTSGMDGLIDWLIFTVKAWEGLTNRGGSGELLARMWPRPFSFQRVLALTCTQDRK